MEKMKLLSVFLLCLAITGIAVARYRVINVDINGYTDFRTYKGGEGAFPGGDVWRAYYGGWGVPVGSDETVNLGWDRQGDLNEPNFASIYAAQVWIGDPGTGDRAYMWSDPNNPGLMNDGFVALQAIDPNYAGAGDPNIQIYGRDAFTGNFDVYVYGAADGNFTMEWPGLVGGPITQSVSGGYDDVNGFILGQNYVIFEDVNVISSTYPEDRVYLSYSNQLNALQFVKKKPAAVIPIVFDNNEVDPKVLIPATQWDVYGEYNNRASYEGGDAETINYGPSPSTFEDPNFPAWVGESQIGTIDRFEYATYDVEIFEPGLYEISGLINAAGDNGRSENLGILVNERVVGRNPVIGAVTDPCELPIKEGPKIERVTVNLWPGIQSLGWQMLRLGGTENTGYRILGLYVRKVNDLNMGTDCYAVTDAGFNYLADLNKDCVVDEQDLAILAGQWISCNDPTDPSCD